MTIRGFQERLKSLPNRPWAVVGKGPSFDLIGPTTLHGFNVLVVNTVWSFLPATWVDAPDRVTTHVADLDVLDHSILDSAVHVVMPWHPHVGFRPSRATLDDKPATSVVKLLARNGRLSSYNSTLAAGLPRGPGPRVRVRGFGGSSAVSLLATCGVKSVWLAGIDGGKDYAARFPTSTLLVNGQKSFDAQFAELRWVRVKHGCQLFRLTPTGWVDWKP